MSYTREKKNQYQIAKAVSTLKYFICLLNRQNR